MLNPYLDQKKKQSQLTNKPSLGTLGNMSMDFSGLKPDTQAKFGNIGASLGSGLGGGSMGSGLGAKTPNS